MYLMNPMNLMNPVNPVDPMNFTRREPPR